MQSHMSIYYIIGANPNECFDKNSTKSYLPISDSLILNSIFKLFYDLGDSLTNHLRILAIGQNKNYIQFQQTNNKFYFQFGKTNNVIYKISGDQFIRFHMFSNINHIFNNLITRINKDTSKRILIIMNDHNAFYTFKQNDYIYLLKGISTIESAKDIFIYDESYHSRIFVDLFHKNNKIFKYFQLTNKNQNISSLYYYSFLQRIMYRDFGKYFTIFLEEASRFISNISHISYDFFLSKQFINLNNKILRHISKNYIQKRTKDFFNISVSSLNKKFSLTPNLKITKSMKNKLARNNITTLAHLYIIRYLILIITNSNQKINKCNLRDYFSDENFMTFKEIDTQVFHISFEDQNISDQESDKLGKKLISIFNIYFQFYQYNINFFNFKSNIEIVSSTNTNKSSNIYKTIDTNCLTNIFLNSPSFAFFVRNAFFNYNQYFDFDSFYRSVHENVKEFLYNPIFTYKIDQKRNDEISLINDVPKRSIYSNQKDFQFNFLPSNSLPRKIAAIRFIIKYIHDYIAKFQNIQFPKLDFSCGFSIIPSDILINFISFSILPNSNGFSNLKLNNENLLNILKFSNLIFYHSEKKFQFIAFFSIILSSEIRFMLAKNLIKIIKNSPEETLDNSIYLFSIDELKYAQDFIKSNDLNISNNSNESIQIFLKDLFSNNHIDKYNSIITKKSQRMNETNKIEKSSRFNLQKMFLDLESSIINIMPSDIFIFFAIYSYLIFMNRSQISDNSTKVIQKNDMLQILFQIFDINSLNKDAKQKIESFGNNSLMNILIACNQYVSMRLQETFNILQLFFRNYYFINFLKIYNRYVEIPDNLRIFIQKFKEISMNFNSISFVEELSNKLKPFPLFCLPSILCLPKKNNIFDELLSSSPTRNNEVKDIFITSLLLDSTDFYSKQFRINLSNLSLYTKFKNFLLENIALLAKISNNSLNDLSYFSSLTFFKDISPRSFNFEFGFEEEEEEYIENSKCSIEFFNDAENRNSMWLYEEFKKAISNYINHITNEIFYFLKLKSRTYDDPRNCIEEDKNYNMFFQAKIQILLEETHEKEHPYIQIIKDNFMNLNKSFPISKYFEDNDNIKEQLSKIIDQLAFSILEARFNNKIEIEPIVKLIPEYEEKFTNEKYWHDPTESEFMALCSAIPFAISTKDQFRKNIIIKPTNLISEEEDNNDFYSPTNSPSNLSFKADDYPTVFKNEDHFEELSNNPAFDYEESINEALKLSASIKIYLQKKHDVTHKKWTKVIWDIFIDLFNTKLKEIHLKFDLNDKQLNKSWYIFGKENYEITKHFYALYKIPDLVEKESLIFFFYFQELRLAIFSILNL